MGAGPQMLTSVTTAAIIIVIVSLWTAMEMVFAICVGLGPVMLARAAAQTTQTKTGMAFVISADVRPTMQAMAAAQTTQTKTETAFVICADVRPTMRAMAAVQTTRTKMEMVFATTSLRAQFKMAVGSGGDTAGEEADSAGKRRERLCGMNRK